MQELSRRPGTGETLRETGVFQERGFSYPRTRSLLYLAMGHGWSERGRLKDAPPMGDIPVPSTIGSSVDDQEDLAGEDAGVGPDHHQDPVLRTPDFLQRRAVQVPDHSQQLTFANPHSHTGAREK